MRYDLQLQYFLNTYARAPGLRGATQSGGNQNVLSWFVVQAGFSVHFWKKLPFFAQMINSMYSSDPDMAQSILT